MNNRQLITISYHSHGQYDSIVRVLEAGVHPGEFAIKEVRDHILSTTGITEDQLRQESVQGIHKMDKISFIDLSQFGYTVSILNAEETAQSHKTIEEQYNAIYYKRQLDIIEYICEKKEIQDVFAKVLDNGGVLPSKFSLEYDSEYNDEGYDDVISNFFILDMNGDVWDDKDVTIYCEDYEEEVSLAIYFKNYLNSQYDIDSFQRFIGYDNAPFKAKLLTPSQQGVS